jgi:hypothetical protein
MNSTDLETVKNYIYNIDFSQIISKMVTRDGWIQEDAQETCKQYRNYIFLNKKYSDILLPPSLDIDLFWHEHILDTQKYIYDCNIIFGRYLHHYPYFGIDGKSTESDVEQQFKIMQDLYFNEFSKLLVPTRSGYKPFVYKILYKFNRIVKI